MRNYCMIGSDFICPKFLYSWMRRLFSKLSRSGKFQGQFFLLLFLLSACAISEEAGLTTPLDASFIKNNDCLDTLGESFSFLPERLFAYGEDSCTLAFYNRPVTRYRHGILGDFIEAGELVFIRNAETHRVQLTGRYVFEDLVPRVKDLDQDGEPEIICIRSHLQRGAGIVVYKIIEGQLEEYAYLPEIGLSARWLNIAAIDDLDQDGRMELAWVQTPHIGGILKVARFRQGKLSVLATCAGLSNHQIGSRNLDLSLLREEKGDKILYLPNQSGTQVKGILFAFNRLFLIDEIEQLIDFNQPLSTQIFF